GTARSRSALPARLAGRDAAALRRAGRGGGVGEPDGRAAARCRARQPGRIRVPAAAARTCLPASEADPVMIGTFMPFLVAAASEGGEFDIKEMILHHLADSPYWETPFGVVHLPQFAPVHLGPITLDF